MLKLEPNKNQTQDETSKANIDPALNVNPSDDGKSTSTDPKPTEPSKAPDNDGVQAKIQEHVELRKKAETEAEAARAEAKKLQEKNEALRREKAEILVKTRIEKSNLPQTLKDRAFKNPLKFVVGNSTKAVNETNFDEVEKLVTEELDGLVGGLEKDFGAAVTSFPVNTFVDSDNVPSGTPGKTLSQGTLSKMTPYEIANLPEEVKQELRKAGGKLN